MSMDQAQFQREQNYLICLSYLKKLREHGLMTEPEFSEAQQILVKKYEPPLGTLLTENP